MSAPRKRRVFPFTAVIGQEEMKLALLLNVIDPRIGGVMIMGDRGTGKSTTIRALADLLPDIDVAAGDPDNSSATDPDLQASLIAAMTPPKLALSHIQCGGDLLFALSSTAHGCVT